MEHIENTESLPVDSSKGVPAKNEVSHESLFGGILLGSLVLVVLLVIIGTGYTAYIAWKANKEQATRPSITELAVKSEESQPVKEVTAVTAVAEEATTLVVDAQQKDISVQNGGAAKGTAGVVADVLKQAGYTKVTASNTINDYSGTVIYYAIGLEKEAATLKESLVKKYPTILIKPAVASNKETSAASLTVIIGK
jgi:flagellar basal body-associated protein FliL